MGVCDAAQISNSANWSNSTSWASLGFRSHCALIFRAYEAYQYNLDQEPVYISLTFSSILVAPPFAIILLAKLRAEL